MKTTLDKSQAHRFDRFTTDVNAVFKRMRTELPGLRKTKLPEEKVFADVFIFWYIDKDNITHYIQQ